jgi:hypothetical protein
MAKKIIIDFSAQPLTDSTGFNYDITVDGFDIYYNTGGTVCEVKYIPFGDTPADITELAIGSTLEETISFTLDHLRSYYVNSIVYYSIVDNTIEVLVNADATIVIDPIVNDSLEVTQQTIEPSGINLIYYLIFDNYRVNIYKENFAGTASEIYGSFAIKKSSVENILDPIRGTALQLSLEANSSLTFDEFLLNDEFTYKTELLKDGLIIFEGYIKPDGTQQSYVNDEWLINIESSDGLGALKDLSFVQMNGLHFTGKMSFYDVIKACLDRTRLSMDINTSINIEYNGYTGDNILKDVFVNSERFIKNSNDTILMDCNEVLTSILNLFSGVITQQDGQWWIYRPNDLVANGYTTFINQTTNATFLKNLNKTLGSQIDNFYPHHCDNNQQIEVKGAISAYRLNYQYGFLDGYLINPNLNHTDELVYNGWTVNPSLAEGILLNNPLDLSGVLMAARTSFGLTEVMESDGVATLEGTQLTLKVKAQTTYWQNYFYFKVKTSDGYFLNFQNEWQLGEGGFLPPFVRFSCGKDFLESISTATYQLLMPPVPNDCDVSVVICRPVIDTTFGYLGTSEITYLQVSDETITRDGIVGEFHTVTRTLPPSSITKENQKVFNGDGELILIGSIYKEDETTVTDFWNRIGKEEQLPLLGISAMDDLRIQASPIKVFSGGVFGELPYMSVVTINNVNGLFMPIEYDYDYKTNKSVIKLMQFYNLDLADIYYEVSPDYGNSTIKPTIKG